MINLKVEIVDIDTLRPDTENLNEHSEENIEFLRQSLREYGQQFPLVADESGTIAAGSGRWRAMKLEGWTEVAVNFSNLAPDKLKEFALADNQTAKSSNLNQSKLETYLSLLDKRNKDFKWGKLGFSQDRIDEMKAGFKKPVFQAPAPIEKIELNADEEFTPLNREEKKPFRPEDKPKGDYIKLVEDQRAVVNQAVSIIRAKEGNYKLPDAVCLELICLEFIASQDENE